MNTRITRTGRRAAGLAIGLTAVVALTVLRVVVFQTGGTPLPLDVWWNERMADAVSDPVLVIAWVPAIVGGTVGMIVIGALLIVLFLWRGRRWDAAALACAMVAVVAVGATMAAVLARTRPADSLAESVATSFPSGHTAVATTVVIILGLALRRWYVWVLGVVWVLTMMWSRTYLHAHWLTDVTAGMLEGIAVALLVWVSLDALRHRRALRAAQHVSTPDRTVSAS
ncbi:hypothetical protein SRABI76_02182 [Microbacterium oxydans]|uniref:Phosphatidylglycerophosphatase B n=1 Tax=Microbacterium oxydans TaxID=82380 RepID=A0A0F0LGC9_9MICO|nr:phosphatase PAP2 family protein [Microbacterium oxydans]KJL30616.1 phosphatidylglycerophosphatase B [Microbacterium oxydans]CAH0207745.1 hypothetical protein SRABI76_02182 [Microbacterium oxydans]